MVNGEYNDALWNKKCLIHLMNRTQNKDHKIRNLWNQQNVFVLLWWQICILNNGYHKLVLGF